MTTEIRPDMADTERRLAALDRALGHHHRGDADSETVIATAEAFDAFLTGDGDVAVEA